MQIKKILVACAIIVPLGAVLVSAYSWYTQVYQKNVESPEVITVPDELMNAFFYTRTTGEGYVVTNGQLSRVTAQQPRPASLKESVSADGTKKTYARADGAGVKGQDGVMVVDFSKWYVLLESDGQKQVLAQGYAPAFLDNEHISYFTQGGLVVYNITTKEYRMAMNRSSELKLLPEVQYSPSRTYVLWAEADGNKVVSRLSAQTFEPLKVYTSAPMLILTDSTVYELKNVEEGTALFDRGHDGAKSVRVVTFPRALGISGVSL